MVNPYSQLPMNMEEVGSRAEYSKLYNVTETKVCDSFTSSSLCSL